ncbi:Fc.00g004570.m01.CDS01 [Cosmosporella sp. VM-42]
MALIDAPKCNGTGDGPTPSDAGVAGTGILLSFMITACLALVLSSSVIFGEFRGKQSIIRRKLLNGYSDSQIMQGIGIQSVGLAKMNSLVPYHFFLIWMLSLLSMATHNATLLALVHDYRRDWVIRWTRQFLMFVNLALSCVSGVFVLEGVSKGLDDKTLPIACVWEVDGNGAPSTAGLSYVGTIAVIAGNCIIFGLATWYLHSRNQKFYKLIQIAGIVLMTAIAIGAAIRIILLSQAFGNPSIKLSDQGEKDWSFGQLLSMLLLIMPLVSVIEIYRGEIQVAEPVEDDREKEFDGELQSNPQNRSSFQPNPFFGSKTNLFTK